MIQSARRFGSYLLLLLAPLLAQAQSNEDCLMCHGDRGLTARIRGRTVSLFVDAAGFRSSVHASASCTDCHQGLNPSETPHAKVIKPVDCQTCHETAGYQNSVHGGGAGSEAGKPPAEGPAACKDCHGTHGILSPKDPKSSANRSHISMSPECGSSSR